MASRKPIQRVLSPVGAALSSSVKSAASNVPKRVGSGFGWPMRATEKSRRRGTARDLDKERRWIGRFGTSPVERQLQPGLIGPESAEA